MKLTAIKQSELYKHINIDESKVCAATVEEERPIRKVITSEINGHRSPNVKMRKRACVHAGVECAAPTSQLAFCTEPRSTRSVAALQYSHVAPESIKSNHKSSDTQ